MSERRDAELDASKHPDNCGCAVCKHHREELRTSQRAREREAEKEPDTPEQKRDAETTHEEHHYHSETERHTEHHHTETKTETRRETARERDHHSSSRSHDRATRRRAKGSAKKHHRHPSFLKTLVVGLILLWLVKSFYPDLNVPVIPGIVCSGPSAGATTVSAATEQTGLDIPLPTPPTLPRVPVPPKNLPDIPNPADTVGKIVKAAAVGTAELVLHAAGATFRELASHPPRPQDIATGLQNDARDLGHITGFIVGAFAGKHYDPLAGTNVSYTSGCGQCPTTAAPVSGPTADGPRTAARAVLRAGWTGEDAITAVAVAGAESGWRRNARNPSTASGLFQMKYPMHANLFHGASWRDPYANARAAHELWKQTGWAASWAAYTNGTYKRHLAAARAALAAVHGVPGGNVQPVAYKASTGSTTVDGQKVSTIAARQLRLAEADGHINLTVVQGGYGGRHIAASGSSHNYPGVMDVTPGTVGVEQLLRAHGFAAWARNIPGRSSVGSGAHVHAVSLLDAADKKSPQVFGSWAHHGNGLAGANNDPAARPAWVPGLVARAKAGTVAAATDCAAGGTAQASYGSTHSGFAVSTLNVLGASHHRQGPPARRMAQSVQLLNKHRTDIAGLQEFEGVQQRAFDRYTGRAWDRFSPSANSIAWRTSTFAPIERHTVSIPYFNGHHVAMPYVLLRYRTGQLVWVVNVHNPADTAQFHHQQRWRYAAIAREKVLLRQLEATGHPVLMVGDMNDRGRFYGPIRSAGVHASGPTNIDWIVGHGVHFTGHRVDDGALADAATDHPIVTAQVALPSTRMAGE